ncbi:MAG TPA: type II toxin-antitoxin system RelE/ParE family toxin [Candidatus Margulisiibacteriota bacterium]|nr:type II toxin-antitoxin system RelE/ParE family toxin [Candidatus Margulisiibacteriota bacterium]
MREAYVLSPLAQSDREEIFCRIAADDFDTAVRVDGELERVLFRRTDLLPRRFRVWPFYSYLVIYKPETSPLEIVRIWHSAQRLPQLI